MWNEEVAVRSLESEDPVTRSFAIDTVTKLGLRNAFDLILACLADPDQGVRCSAVFALGELRDERALAHLLRVAREAEPRERDEAFVALGAFRHPDIGALALATLPDLNSSRMARAAAARQLKGYDSPETVAALSRALREEADAWVAELAAESLQTLNRPSLAPLWREMLDDISNTNISTIARASLRALGEM